MEEIILNVNYRGKKYPFKFDDDRTMKDLTDLVYSHTGITADYQKLIVPGKGMIKPGTIDGQQKVSEVFDTRASRNGIMIMGSPPEKIDGLSEAETQRLLEHNRLMDKYRARQKLAKKPRPTRASADDFEYTFDKLTALAMLPNQDKSLDVLQRLKDDKGVRAVMKKYKLKVGVLTELDPASNTSHGTRLLGLNEGNGATIRLRLRTDDYEGWCSYREIRKVLCHELTHNYYGDHDRQFWDMCNKLEKEVVELDPFGQPGQQIGPDVYDGPGEPGFGQELYDDGGCEISQDPHVLGGIESSKTGEILSLRQKILQATETRAMQKGKERKEQDPTKKDAGESSKSS